MQRKLLTAPQVRERFGDISDMTLWRWLESPTLGFPRPVYIQRRRFFDAAEIEAWEAKRRTAEVA